MCGGTDLEKVTKNSAALKVPKSTVASIILKWKKFGTTRTLPRAGRRRRALVREVTKNPDFKGPVCKWEKLPEGQPSLQHTTRLGFMAEWPERSLSSVKDT